MRFSRRRGGLSALFDAMLFFMIILAATGALFRWSSTMTAQTTDDLSTRDLGRYASDIQAAALSCTVGPVNYSAGAGNQSFTGTVHDCILTALECTMGPERDIAGLVDAARAVFSLLVEKPYHFALNASIRAAVPHLFIAEKAGLAEKAGEVRWTCAVPLIGNGIEGELILLIWR